MCPAACVGRQPIFRYTLQLNAFLIYISQKKKKSWILELNKLSKIDRKINTEIYYTWLNWVKKKHDTRKHLLANCICHFKLWLHVEWLYETNHNKCVFDRLSMWTWLELCSNEIILSIKFTSWVTPCPNFKPLSMCEAAFCSWNPDDFRVLVSLSF